MVFALQAFFWVSIAGLGALAALVMVLAILKGF